MVELEHVSVRYPGADADAVHDLSFAVAPGERVGLLGSSGAGKSSVLNLIAGLVRPTHGIVRAGVGAADIGMVHQQFQLVPSLRVVHNVNAGVLGRWSLGKALASLWVSPRERESVNEVLAKLGIEDKLLLRTADLSGGQQQRVAVARVLRQRPQLFLADEPVSAVDPRWSEEVLGLLTDEARQRNASLIVSLHDVDLARTWCDRLIGLRFGRMMFDSPADRVTDDMLSELYEFTTDAVAART
jgi:phosphonate transport system ATP-binding protein